MSQFKSEESVFNFALEYLKQIADALKMCCVYSTNQDVTNWCKWIRVLYRQLSIKLKPEEEADILGDNSKPVDITRLLDNVIDDDEANFKNIYFLMKPEYLIQYKQTILFLLDRLEVKIRKMLQQKGMLLPSKADPRFAILER